MRILYDNALKTATITKSSERTNYPSTNLITPHLSQWFKTTSADGEYLIFAGSITASYFALLNHNLTSSAIVILEGNDTNVWTAPSFSLTMTYADYIMLEDFTQATYSFWRVTFSDATNPDGYIRLGGAYLGTYLQMPGMKIDQEIIDNSTTSIDYSATRQLYADLGIDFAEFTINFPFIITTLRDAMRVMWNTVGNHTPVIALIWESDLTMQLPIYCHLTEPIRWKRNDNFNLRWGTSMKFAEVF